MNESDDTGLNHNDDAKESVDVSKDDDSIEQSNNSLSNKDGGDIVEANATRDNEVWG